MSGTFIVSALLVHLVTLLQLVSPYDYDVCFRTKQHLVEKRDVPTLIGAGTGGYSDEESGFEPKLVLHYNFDKQKSFIQSSVRDSSPFENNGRFTPGGLVLQIPGSTCGNAAFLGCSEILLNGETFQAKPSVGITIAAWVMILKQQGRHNIFETYGLSHAKGQFHFEVDYGILRWFHRNEAQAVVFEVAGELIPEKTWTHVVGTYNSSTNIAQVFINGKPTNRTIGRGAVSKDWTCLAHISGGCNGKPLFGFLDEFRMYNYDLSFAEVQSIMDVCQFSDTGLQPPINPSPAAATSPNDGDMQDDYYLKRSQVPSDSKSQYNARNPTSH